MEPFLRANWIWSRDRIPENQHVCFRTVFKGGSGNMLHISADSDFVAFLNGVKVGQGQFSDWPEEKTYSSFDVSSALLPGRNVLAVLAYYRGRGFSTYAPGAPGLIAELGDAASGPHWRCRPHPAFTSGEIAVTTGQLGFCAAFDARQEDAWCEPDYDDSHWEFACEVESRTLAPRPVPSLCYLPPVPGKCVMQGQLFRRREEETFAASMAADFLLTLPAAEAFGALSENANGYFAIVDLGAAYAGLLNVRLSAPAGTVCDLSVGEHLDDGRIRSKIGYRNFADRYICREGKNEFEFPFRRVAGRYVGIHITNVNSGSVTLNYLGIAPTEVSLPQSAEFVTPDRLFNRRYQVAVRTMTLCMHEHYEDCPWREQALYAYDSRNQALYGYYRWGNYRFARASIDLLGRDLRPDGLLQLCAPCRIELTIPAFSFVWVSEIAEYELHSGDLTLFDRYCGQIETMLQAVLPRYDASNGLFTLPDQKFHWHFYEWTPGLDGIPFGTRTGIHAGFNLYFYEMIGSYLTMLERRGRSNETFSRIRRDLGHAIHRQFWDEENQAYATCLHDGKRQGFHEHIQALALYNRIVPEAQVPMLLATLQSRTLASIAFNALCYLIRALMRCSPESRQEASARLTAAFEPLILAGASTLWETAQGAADFNGAGSLCHAWSSTDVYFAHAEVLGVKPLAPGFTRFAIAPYPNGLQEAKGTISTPHGSIQVEWCKRDYGLEYHATGPAHLHPELRGYPEVALACVTYNGRSLFASRTLNRELVGQLS